MYKRMYKKTYKKNILVKSSKINTKIIIVIVTWLKLYLLMSVSMFMELIS